MCVCVCVIFLLDVAAVGHTNEYIQVGFILLSIKLVMLSKEILVYKCSLKLLGIFEDRMYCCWIQ